MTLSKDIMALAEPLAELHAALKESRRYFGEVGSRDADIVAWNERIDRTMIAVNAARAALERRAAVADELLEALQMGYAETMDYIRLNKLGGEDNQWLRMARAAIAHATQPTDKERA